jgi:hypothetical protein
MVAKTKIPLNISGGSFAYYPIDKKLSGSFVGDKKKYWITKFKCHK